MKLSELIIDYRTRMKISQREFSRKCDLSNTYISFIENEKNPKTGRPVVPTLEQYKKIAHGMGITVQRLFELLDDDAPVDLGGTPSELSDDQPETDDFRLFVRDSSKTVVQFARPQSANTFKVYTRLKNSGTWGEWKSITFA